MRVPNKSFVIKDLYVFHALTEGLCSAIIPSDTFYLCCWFASVPAKLVGLG